jgi:hypothetical protein
MSNDYRYVKGDPIGDIERYIQYIDGFLGLDNMNYLGYWDASTNTPTLEDAVGDIGDMYVASSAGTVDFGNGNIDFAEGQAVVFNEDGQWIAVGGGAGGGGAVSSVFSRTGAVSAQANDYNTDQILFSTDHDHINTAQDVINHIWSPGACASGGSFDLTDNGNGTVDIADGSVTIRTSNQPHGELQGFSVSGEAGLALTDESTNIIFVDYNLGTPAIDVTTDINVIFEDNTKIGIYSVNRLGNEISVIDFRSYNVDYIRKNSFKDFKIGGIEHSSGSVVADEGSLQFSVTSGLYYVASISIESLSIDTSVAGTYERVYRDGSGGWTRVSGQTAIDNANYDAGTGTLAPVTAGYFTNSYLYAILDHGSTTYKVVYDTDEHTTLAEAQLQGSPSSLPSDLNSLSNAVFVAKIITEQGQTAFADIQTPNATVLSSNTASNHNSLSGIQGGDSDDYQHLSTTELTAIRDLRKLDISVAHTFSVGDTVYNDGGTWTLSQSDNKDTLTQGVVSEVVDANNFSIVFIGPITYASPHGYTVGDYLFTDASTAGLLTETEPTGLTQFSDPAAVVLDASTIFVLPWRPQNAIPRSNDLKIVSISTDRVVTDTDEFILCDATTGDIVVTLPTPSSDYDGFTVKVKKVDSSANTVTVKTDTGYNIDGVDGATGQVLSLQHEVVSASCDAANYYLG